MIESCESRMCGNKMESCGCSCKESNCGSGGCSGYCGLGGSGGGCGGGESYLEMFMKLKKKAMMDLIMERVKKRLEQTNKEKYDKIADVIVEMAMEHMRLKKEMMKGEDLQQKLMDIMQG